MFSTLQLVGQRERQEDSFTVGNIDLLHDLTADVAQLFVVADGMGGHSGGEIASQLAVDVFRSSVELCTHWTKSSLVDALLEANSRLAQEVSLDARLVGMGTTFLGVHRWRNRLNWVSVGDSLLLLFRDLELRRLNEDHSMLPELIKAAEHNGLSGKCAHRDPRRHQLRSALTGKTPKLIDLAQCELRQGDLLVIASDGIETLSMNDIAALLERNRERAPGDLVELIMSNIEQRKAAYQDNVTLIVYRHMGLDQ